MPTGDTAAAMAGRALRAPLLLLLCPACTSAAAPTADAGETCTAGSGPCGSSAGSYYWPTQKGSAERTGFTPHAVPDISKSPAWTWTDPYEDVIRATPLIDDRLNVYLSTIAGRVYKFDVSGKMLWKRYLPYGTQVVGCLYEGKFIIATKTGLVVALDMETGKDLWQAPVSPIQSTAGDTASVLAVDGLVISATNIAVGNNDGNDLVVAVKAEDGSIQWQYRPEVKVYNFQASAPQDGTIVFQDRAGGLYRLSLADGSEVWKSGKRGPAFSSFFTTGAAVCHGGKVFVVSNFGANALDQVPGLLHVYKLVDGSFIWEQVLAYSANQAVTVGPHPTESGKFIAVVGVGANPNPPGSVVVGARWGRSLTGHILGTFWDRYLARFFIKNGAAMAAYDTETGKRVWHYELPPYRKMATSGDSERLVKRFTDLMTNNSQNDPFCLPDSCSQPVIGPDGTAYQGWQDGRIYAVRDANGDGKIDESEVSFHQLSDGFQGSMGLAPGLLAAAPCGGGLYVWRS